MLPDFVSVDPATTVLLAAVLYRLEKSVVPRVARLESEIMENND